MSDTSDLSRDEARTILRVVAATGAFGMAHAIRGRVALFRWVNSAVPIPETRRADLLRTLETAAKETGTARTVWAGVRREAGTVWLSVGEEHAIDRVINACGALDLEGAKECREALIRSMLDISIAQADRGELISGEEVMARLDDIIAGRVIPTDPPPEPHALDEAVQARIGALLAQADAEASAALAAWRRVA